ncbi:MAG: CHAP domain-containing protein [Gammaproteobacteria bacterium]
MKRLAFVLDARCLRAPAVALLLLCQTNAWAATAPPAGKLPAACRTGCVTPFGAVLGVVDGLPAYSNCSAQCVDPEPVKTNGVYTGIKWQCVEFARRWLLRHDGAVFGDVDVAADIWNKIDHLERVDDKGSIALQNHPNGSARPPSAGDLLIYARAYLGTGHVAVVTAVNLPAHEIEVAEQNYLNNKYPGGYARRITLIERNHRYWVLDPYVLGWKHPATATRTSTKAVSPR